MLRRGRTLIGHVPTLVKQGAILDIDLEGEDTLRDEPYCAPTPDKLDSPLDSNPESKEHDSKVYETTSEGEAEPDFQSILLTTIPENPDTEDIDISDEEDTESESEDENTLPTG